MLPEPDPAIQVETTHPSPKAAARAALLAWAMRRKVAELHAGEKLMRLLGTIALEWFDPYGRPGDPVDVVGRRGADVAEFMLQTLGWIYVVRDGGLVTLSIDTRAGDFRRIERTLEELTARSSAARLWTIHAFDGHACRIVRAETADLLLARLHRACGPARRANDVTSAKIAAVFGPAELPAELVALIRAWSDHHGRQLVCNADWPPALPELGPDFKLKTLLRDPDGRFRIGLYRPLRNTLWNEAERARFAGARLVETLPDEALAHAVEHAALATLARARPTVERWRGRLKATNRVMSLEWLRASFPLPAADGGLEAVLVACQVIEPH